MNRFFSIWVAFVASVQAAGADSVIPTRTLRANTVITHQDVALSRGGADQGYLRLADVVGQETRVALYPGRPILAGDIGPPSIVLRNQIVQVSFDGKGLQIVTEGRALDRGAVGERIRVMNISSRATVFGTVQEDGTIQVNH
jgi:flagella basal body P-ring formation protein FlgA